MSRVLCAAFLWSVVFLSCLGAGSQIKLNNDGSGTIRLDYRIASDLEKIGELEGNARWLPVPVGRSDLERTIARIEGLRLVSYSSSTDGADAVHSADMSFSSIEALSSFFDATGRFFEADLPGKTIKLIFPGETGPNSDFKELLTSSLQGYDFSFSLTLPGTAKLSWLDGEGKNTEKYPGTCLVRDSVVEYRVPMADLVFLDTGLTMEIRW
jgi:hypothetical protein